MGDGKTHPWAQGFTRRGVDPNDYPNVNKWAEKIHKRPAVKKGIKVLADCRSSEDFSAEEREVLFGKTQFKRR